MYTIVILFAIGIGFLYGSFSYKEKLERLSKTGEIVEGIIFDFAANTSTNSEMHYPIVRFVTKKGYWITLKSDVGFNDGYYKQGDAVTVTYNPNRPEEFTILSTSSPLPTLFTVIGIGMLLGGIYALMGYLGYFE